MVIPPDVADEGTESTGTLAAVLSIKRQFSNVSLPPPKVRIVLIQPMNVRFLIVRSQSDTAFWMKALVVIPFTTCPIPSIVPSKPEPQPFHETPVISMSLWIYTAFASVEESRARSAAFLT